MEVCVLTKVVRGKVVKVIVCRTFQKRVKFGVKNLKEIHRNCLKYCSFNSSGHHIVLSCGLNLPHSGYQLLGQIFLSTWYVVYFTLHRYQLDGSLFIWTVEYKDKHMKNWTKKTPFIIVIN